MYFYSQNIKGFTFIEVLIASSIFLSLLVGGNSLMHYLSEDIVYMRNMLQSDFFAQSSLSLAEDIFLEETLVNWNAHIALLAGSPKSAEFHLVWNGTQYVIQPTVGYEGPLNVYSESINIQVPFYRKVVLEELDAIVGLYDIEVDVCFEDCEQHVKLHKLIHR